MDSRDRRWAHEQQPLTGRTSASAQSIVIAQIAVALCLLAGASLVARSLVNLQQIDKGFDPEGRLTFNVVLPATRFPDAPAMHAFYARLLDTIAARPEFTSVGTTTAFPLSGQDLENSFAVDGYAAASPDQSRSPHCVVSAPAIPPRWGFRSVPGAR